MTPIHVLGDSQVDALREFLARVPEAERRWFRDDILSTAVVEGWIRDDRRRNLVVAGPNDRRVLAYGAVQGGRGSSSHVGELTLIVDPESRRQGYGSALARALLMEALRMGLTKVVVEVVADEASAIAMFGSLGFEPEAMLRDHVRDRQGGFHDLMILAHPVAETWAVMAATGVEDAVLR